MARSLTTLQTPTRTSLLRLLASLDKSLSSSSETLRQDPYARAKFGANLEYARGLLLTLENESSAASQKGSGKNGARDVQSLGKEVRKRIRELNEQLHELALEGEDEESSEDEVDERTPSKTHEPVLNEKAEVEGPTLRNRRQGEANRSDTSRGQTTSTSIQEPSSAPEEATATVTALEKQESEQTVLTSSLVEMAAALKASTRQFSQTLEAEKDILDRTGEGLQKNKDGLDSAGKKMGTLRKMSEGRGWYGRLLIYAYIAGLWIVAILLLFLPKLRF